MILVKKRDYKNGGASYGILGVRGSVYVSTGLFTAPEDRGNKMPSSIDLNLADGFGFASPNAKAEERKAAKAEREAKRTEKKAERQAAKDAKAAARQTTKDAKAAQREQKKAERERKRKEKADAKQAAKDAKAAAKAAAVQAQVDAVNTTPLS